MKRPFFLSAMLPALFAPSLLTMHMAERGAASAGGSEIEKELLEATDLGTKRGEDRQDFIARLMKGVAALDDKAWDGLSKPAQEWFNDAADFRNDKANAGKDLPDFPDLPKPETGGRRRAAEPEAKEERLTKVGDTATVLTKRGKSTTGKVVELDEKIIVLNVEGEGELEFSMDRVESITVNHGTSGQAAEEPADPVAVGASVVLKTKRGKEVAGKIVELTDDLIVLDVDGKEEEFSRERVESITPTGAAKPAAGSSRRGSAAAEPEVKEKPTRSSNPAGVSVGQRIRELMAEDTSITQEAVGKILTKEKLEFKETSLKMNYGDNAKFLDCLKAAGQLKK